MATKVAVTAGVTAVTLITLARPDLTSHLGVLGLALLTNLVWIWR